VSGVVRKLVPSYNRNIVSNTIKHQIQVCPHGFQGFTEAWAGFASHSGRFCSSEILSAPRADIGPNVSSRVLHPLPFMLCPELRDSEPKTTRAPQPLLVRSLEWRKPALHQTHSLQSCLSIPASCQLHPANLLPRSYLRLLRCCCNFWPGYQVKELETRLPLLP
jgi:hypothetical protein